MNRKNGKVEFLVLLEESLHFQFSHTMAIKFTLIHHGFMKILISPKSLLMIYMIGV